MILEVKELSFSYTHSREIFKDVSFGIEKGEIMTILGPNGAGKSTLLNCIGNLHAPSSGEILLKGKPLASIKLAKVAQCIGYVPQIHIPAYAFTVRDFVVMGRTPYMSMLAQPKQEDYEMVHQVLKKLEIEHLAYKPYTEISGGERQKVTIARARYYFAR